MPVASDFGWQGRENAPGITYFVGDPSVSQGAPHNDRCDHEREDDEVDDKE